MKEKLRSKIIVRLMKEGSSAEEPTNIDLTDYSSDEGDTSDSSVSEKEETLIEESWSCNTPPPTPTFLPLQSFEAAKRRNKKGSNTKSYLRRKRMLTGRAVMDLPTTDPGSDLCDLTDSADEGATRTEESSARSRERCKDGGTESNEKERITDSLILPEIVRPRSVSLGENLRVNKKEPKTNKRSQCLHLIRAFRHRAPVQFNQDVQIKLSSLRQQIWMGVPLNVAENGKNIEHPFAKAPLSWGISNMARERMDNDILLKSYPKKSQSLDYVTIDENTKKAQIKCKPEEILEDTSPEIENQCPHSKSKKKKSRHKWQKLVNLNTKAEESNRRKASFLTIKTDSLKLITLEIPSKTQTRQNKIDSKRKHRKSGATCSISNTGKTSNIAKSQIKPQTRSQVQLQPLIVPLCDSFSSDDSNDYRRNRISKKKQKKKKQLKKIKKNGSI